MTTTAGRLGLRAARRRPLAARSRVRVLAARRRAHRARARRPALVRRELLSGTSAGSSGWWCRCWIAADAATRPRASRRNLFLFSLFGAMAAAVWLEFLARPGHRHARADRSRSRCRTRCARCGAAGGGCSATPRSRRIAVRNGLGPSLGLGRKDDVDDRRAARPPVRRLRLALEQCGGMFVKLGPGAQHPHRPDLAAGGRRARAAPGPRARRRRATASPRCSRRSSTRPVDDVFRGFDWQPVAAASIGQVYRAQLPDGSPVVVKVQRPGIDESVAVDLSVLDELGTCHRDAHVVGRRVPRDGSRRRVLGRVCARSSTSASRPATRTPSRPACPADRASSGAVRVRRAQHVARARDGVARRRERARGRLGRRARAPIA